MYIHGQRPGELGGITLVEAIADKQRGPTCGFEAVENVIQLYRPENNDLIHTDLIPRARGYGFLQDTGAGPMLQVRGYRRILADYHIPSKWEDYDPFRVLIPALRQNRVALAIVDAHHLDSAMYPRRPSLHAIVITNFVTGASDRKVWGFTGIDSNVEGELAWHHEEIARAIKAVQPQPKLLVTETPSNWHGRADHYRRMPDGTFVAV